MSEQVADLGSLGGGGGQDEVYVTTFTRGRVGPSETMLGPVKSGGRIVTGTPPGCWSPMITPAFQGGHEVTQPVAVEGAEVGDSVALTLERCRNVSEASSSGVDSFLEGRYKQDPFVAKICPNCGAENPESYGEGIGPESIHCKECGAEASVFRFAHGYTVVMDKEHDVAITVPPEVAAKVANNAKALHHSPANVAAHPILLYGAGEMPGVITRVMPFLGNIGTTPSANMPDSHNAGDFGQFLIGADHEFGVKDEEELNRHKTDGHMDCAQVREGAVLICPVKVPQAGVYMGDMHAMQGNGEVAGHATDSASEVECRVDLLKGVTIDGPILLPVYEDLPHLLRPVTKEMRRHAEALAQKYGVGELEESGPVQFIGSGKDLNAATKNGLERAAKATGLSFEEVQNRATITGSIEIGRLPGVVKVGLLCPMPVLDRMGIGDIVRKQYDL